MAVKKDFFYSLNVPDSTAKWKGQTGEIQRTIGTYGLNQESSNLHSFFSAASVDALQLKHMRKVVGVA